MAGRDGPATVTHGDFRTDNLLFDGRGGDVPLATVDWQTVGHGSASLDVAYLLMTSLDDRDPSRPRARAARRVPRSARRRSGSATTPPPRSSRTTRSTRSRASSCSCARRSSSSAPIAATTMFLTMIERSATAVDDLDARASAWWPDAARARRLAGPPGALSLAHAMGGHPNAYDRFLFNAYREDLFFAVALGLYPNRGVDRRRRRGRSTPACSARSSPLGRCGGARRGWGRSRSSCRPRCAAPRSASRRPSSASTASCRFSARSVAIEELRQTRHDGARLFMDVTRASQLGTWCGSLELDGECSTSARRDLRDEGPLVGHPPMRRPRRGRPVCVGAAALLRLDAAQLRRRRVPPQRIRGRATGSHGRAPRRRSTSSGDSTSPVDPSGVHRVRARAARDPVRERAAPPDARVDRRHHVGRLAVHRRARPAPHVPHARRGLLPPDASPTAATTASSWSMASATTSTSSTRRRSTTCTSSRWWPHIGATASASGCSSSARDRPARPERADRVHRRRTLTPRGHEPPR